MIGQWPSVSQVAQGSTGQAGLQGLQVGTFPPSQGREIPSPITPGSATIVPWKFWILGDEESSRFGQTSRPTPCC